MTPWFQYTPLRDSNNGNNDSSEEIVIRKKRSNFSIVVAFLGGVALGTVLAITFVHNQSIFQTTKSFSEPDETSTTDMSIEHGDWTPAPPTPPPRTGRYTTKTYDDGEVIEGTQCGDTWEEAKALGCTYDPLAQRWYSPECFFEEVFDTMVTENNFTLYSDRAHTAEVAFEVAQRGEIETLYPDFDLTYTHCIYLWRKMQHALANNLALDDDLWEEGHTFFCTKMLLKWNDPKVHGVISIFTGGKPFCGRQPVGVMN